MSVTDPTLKGQELYTSLSSMSIQCLPSILNMALLPPKHAIGCQFSGAPTDHKRPDSLLVPGDAGIESCASPRQRLKALEHPCNLHATHVSAMLSVEFTGEREMTNECNANEWKMELCCLFLLFPPNNLSPTQMSSCLLSFSNLFHASCMCQGGKQLLIKKLLRRSLQGLLLLQPSFPKMLCSS